MDIHNFQNQFMPRSYRIKALKRENAAMAYPLIRSAMPTITLEDWLAYTDWHAQPTELREPSTGIMTLENSRGYIHGLFSFCTSYGLGAGPVLNVDHFIAIDTGDRAVAVTRLIDAMEDLAQHNGCTVIHTHLPESWAVLTPGRKNLLAQLVNAGHGRDTVKLSKSLTTG